MENPKDCVKSGQNAVMRNEKGIFFVRYEIVGLWVKLWENEKRYLSFGVRVAHKNNNDVL